MTDAEKRFVVRSSRFVVGSGWLGCKLARALPSRTTARIEPRFASFDWQVTYEEG
jgi:hypothetical protein